jgi:hypothetical protein
MIHSLGKKNTEPEKIPAKQSQKCTILKTVCKTWQTMRLFTRDKKKEGELPRLNIHNGIILIVICFVNEL